VQNSHYYIRHWFLARDVIYYISRLCYDVSVRLSVRRSVTEVHWRIIANLGFKFRSQFTAHCGRSALCMRARGKGSSPGRVEGSSRAMLAIDMPSYFFSCGSQDTAIQIGFHLQVAKTPIYPIMCRFPLFAVLCDHNPPTLHTSGHKHKCCTLCYIAYIPRDRFPRNILVPSSRGSSRGCHEDATRKTGPVEFQLIAA